MPYALISNKEAGNTEDEFAQGVDLVGTVRINDEVVNLYVTNTGTDVNGALWQFSPETVQAIASANIDDSFLIDRVLPQKLQESLIGGVPAGHWLAVVLLIIAAYLLSWTFIFLISLLIRGLWPKSRTDPTSSVVQALGLPFRLYLAVWLFVALSQQVGVSIIIRQRFSAITVIIGIVAILLLMWRLTDIVSSFSKKRMSRRGRLSALSVVLFMRRAAKVAIVIIGGIAILSAIGVDVTAGLAALGIGGIALALGAQKTVENFVGSVTLIADQPIRVGDFCKVGDITGTVEQIGMRSTKLRTSARTVVTIPNGEFSSTTIENFAPRDRFLFSPVIEVRYETTPDQIRYLLVELRSILYSHPMVNPDPARIRFTGFGESSLKLEVWSYINAPSFDVFLEVQEDLLLHMMDVVAQSGTDFAFPSQTLYFARDSGVSKEKSGIAADKVKNWKETNDLQLPGFDTDYIEKIKNTLPYPPEGSVKNKEAENK